MYDGIEALDALARFGTVSLAATHLRLTQSAVSKRIQALQERIGFRLIEPVGRRVRLTPGGLAFLERARPLVAELNGLIHFSEAGETARLSIALADSIASSWGPEAIREVKGRFPGLELEIHAHRSILALENVRSGRYSMALCTEPLTGKDLIIQPIVEEPMVLIPCGFAKKLSRSEKMITIEEGSATWQALGEKIKRHPQVGEAAFLRVESFQAAVQMVRNGFGNGLVPLGIATSMGVPRSVIRPLKPALRRMISLVARPSFAERDAFRRFQTLLSAVANEKAVTLKHHGSRKKG
jgi:DNA-binding transcriptional LysR family regulator